MKVKLYAIHSFGIYILNDRCHDESSSRVNFDFIDFNSLTCYLIIIDNSAYINAECIYYATATIAFFDIFGSMNE